MGRWTQLATTPSNLRVDPGWASSSRCKDAGCGNRSRPPPWMWQTSVAADRSRAGIRVSGPMSRVRPRGHRHAGAIRRRRPCARCPMAVVVPDRWHRPRFRPGFDVKARSPCRAWSRGRVACMASPLTNIQRPQFPDPVVLVPGAEPRPRPAPPMASSSVRRRAERQSTSSSISSRPGLVPVVAGPILPLAANGVVGLERPPEHPGGLPVRAW